MECIAVSERFYSGFLNQNISVMLILSLHVVLLPNVSI